MTDHNIPPVNSMDPEQHSGVPQTESLDQFHTQEQRLILDTVAQIRKCGLDSILSLPQLVVCGDQSAGKSSILEALTEIPFPRNDNLCTRFATEITLRRAPTDGLQLRLIPDSGRPVTEQDAIRQFSEQVNDFGELPTIMQKAMTVMGLHGSDEAPSSRAFARDVLSIEIEGPTRPQLTIVDLPGLIQTETKGVTKQDRDMVAEITDFYIKQERTICLAIISATNDYANQPILTKVRDVDPDGRRTLGIITKPDRLDPNSGSETAFIQLARNEDIFFSLGWHVIKNRKFEETAFSIVERNMSEASFFRKSNFGRLPAENLGIDALRVRLSSLLFDHIKHELPNLRKDLETALEDSRTQLQLLGTTRSLALDCRNYLTYLSMQMTDLTTAALNGHYGGVFFQERLDVKFSIRSPASCRRLRAAVHFLNKAFADTMEVQGPKYRVIPKGESDVLDVSDVPPAPKAITSPMPTDMTRESALNWVNRVIVRCRGKEPIGNYNPLIIGELFWEQSSRWGRLAEDHIAATFDLCKTFLHTLLENLCPRDVAERLSLRVADFLRSRQAKAFEELARLDQDNKDFPSVYNHHYTSRVLELRMSQLKTQLREAVEQATSYEPASGRRLKHTSADVDVAAVVEHFQSTVNYNPDRFSGEDALDHVLSMYEIQKDGYVANVTKQVIERHMIRGLEKFLSPIDINRLSDDEVMKIAAEPVAIRSQREFLKDRNQKLLDGQQIFRNVI